MTDCYVIQATEFQGNCLVASRDIVCGECIVHEELPYVWQSVSIPGLRFHKHCEECGVVLTKQLLESLSAFIDADTVNNGDGVLSALQQLLPLKTLSSTLIPQSCSQNCGVEYCSQKCFDVARLKGHAWLCESYQTLNLSTQQMREIDIKGHFGLANKVYAHIAAQCLLNITEDSSIDLSAEAMRVALSQLSEYHFVDFTRTIHAFRTGCIEEIDPNMFQNIIFPAYFASQLARPFALCKETFSQSGRVLWGAGALGERRSAEFLSSEIFSEQFYSRIIGTFTVNNLSVHVASPLDFILSQAMRTQRAACAAAVNSGNLPDANDMNERVIAMLGRYYNQQQLLQEEEELVESEATSPPRVRRFLGMSGSGLFPIFSKTNHSCVCNTSMHGSDHVSVSIRATEAIAQDAEITNCYIHHHSLNGGEAETVAPPDTKADDSSIINKNNEQHVLNSLMTKKQRYRALRQYVFECECPLCRSQVIDSDEDSD